ncbi:hypothetical protein [Myxococcus landrumensis]|uniref:Lipoprotein n=1 Tax=Myxococcus landrumensis TaxID=2813577 RepID=A0ABX7N2E2_9BACT|nr:hypothetical protein [Myxococcus landrumus]QSQ11830.1 hypothetical protein JY572_25990 [Myxococcus landrumus]
MRTFTRWLTVAAVAAALTVTGCKERSRDNTGATGGSGRESNTMQPGTGGSGPQMHDTDAGTQQR